MRINIDWTAPWVHGKPLRGWVWHRWYQEKGCIRGKRSMGVRLLGLHIMWTTDAVWSGVSFSINVWKAPQAYDPPASR